MFQPLTRYIYIYIYIHIYITLKQVIYIFLIKSKQLITNKLLVLTLIRIILEWECSVGK